MVSPPSLSTAGMGATTASGWLFVIGSPPTCATGLLPLLPPRSARTRPTARTIASAAPTTARRLTRRQRSDSSDIRSRRAGRPDRQPVLDERDRAAGAPGRRGAGARADAAYGAPRPR